MTYILQRLLHGVFVLFGISVVVFGLTQLTGDPASVLLPLGTPPDQIAQFRHQLGLLAAVFHRRLPDFFARFIALIGQSVAAPWLGVMLILVFAVTLRWLPSSGADKPQSIILPAIVAGAYSAAGLSRLLRSSLLEVMANDYMRTARAKGLPTRLVVARHGLKNAAIPVVTFLGLQITFLFGNTVIAEAMFAYPGMSRLAVEAISTRDMPVIQVFVLLAGVLVVIVNLLADLVYAWLDPRIRLA